MSEDCNEDDLLMPDEETFQDDDTDMVVEDTEIVDGDTEIVDGDTEIVDVIEIVDEGTDIEDDAPAIVDDVTAMEDEENVYPRDDDYYDEEYGNDYCENKQEEDELGMETEEYSSFNSGKEAADLEAREIEEDEALWQAFRNSLVTARQEERNRKVPVYIDNEEELKQALDLSLQEYYGGSLEHDDSGFDTASADTIQQEERKVSVRKKMITCVPIDVLMRQPAAHLNDCATKDNIEDEVVLTVEDCGSLNNKRDTIDSSNVNSSVIFSASMINYEAEIVISEHSYADMNAASADMNATPADMNATPADMNATPDQGLNREVLHRKPETSTPNSSRKSVIVNPPTSVIKSRNLWSHFGDESYTENPNTESANVSIVESVTDESSTSQNTEQLVRASVICSRPGSVSSFNGESEKEPINDNDSGVVVNTLLQELVDGVFSFKNLLDINCKPSTTANEEVKDVISTLLSDAVEYNDIPVDMAQNSSEALTASKSDGEIVENSIALIDADTVLDAVDVSGTDRTQVTDSLGIPNSAVNDDNGTDTEIDDNLIDVVNTATEFGADVLSGSHKTQVTDNPDIPHLPVNGNNSTDTEIDDNLIDVINTDTELDDDDVSVKDRSEVTDNPVIPHSAVKSDNSTDATIDVDDVSDKDRTEVIDSDTDDLFGSQGTQETDNPDTELDADDLSGIDRVQVMEIPDIPHSHIIADIDEENEINANNFSDCDRVEVPEIPDTPAVADLPIPSTSSQESNDKDSMHDNSENTNVDRKPSREELQSVAHSSRIDNVAGPIIIEDEEDVNMLPRNEAVQPIAADAEDIFMKQALEQSMQSFQEEERRRKEKKVMFEDNENDLEKALRLSLLNTDSIFESSLRTLEEDEARRNNNAEYNEEDMREAIRLSLLDSNTNIDHDDSIEEQDSQQHSKDDLVVDESFPQTSSQKEADTNEEFTGMREAIRLSLQLTDTDYDNSMEEQDSLLSNIPAPSQVNEENTGKPDVSPSLVRLRDTEEEPNLETVGDEGMNLDPSKDIGQETTEPATVNEHNNSFDETGSNEVIGQNNFMKSNGPSYIPEISGPPLPSPWISENSQISRLPVLGQPMVLENNVVKNPLELGKPPEAGPSAMECGQLAPGSKVVTVGGGVTQQMMNTVFKKGLEAKLNAKEMEPCKSVVTPLHSHQKAALAWMCNQENKQNQGMRGGILGDDMGLGKTLSMIALIVTNHHNKQPLINAFTRPLAEIPAADNTNTNSSRQYEEKHHLRQLLQECDVLSAQMKTSKTHLSYLKSKHEGVVSELTTLRVQGNKVQLRINSVKEELHKLPGERNKLATFGDWMPRLVAEINRNALKFSKLPIGPLGAHITIRDGVPDDIVTILEGELWQLLCAFCCNTNADQILLFKIFNNLNLSRKPLVITSEFVQNKYNITDTRVTSKYISLIDCIETNHPTVYNAIIDSAGLEKIIVIRDQNEAERILGNVKTVPENLKYAVVAGIYQYYPAPNFKSYFKEYRPRNILKANMGEHIQDRNRKDYYKHLMQKKQGFEGVLKQNQVKLNNIKNLIEAEEKKIRTARERINEKQKKITELNSGRKMTSLEKYCYGNTSVKRPFPSDENSAPVVKRPKLEENASGAGGYQHRVDPQPGTSSSSFQPVNRPVLKYRSKNRRPTLVVCPTSLLSHWTNEIEKHIDKDMRLKVHLHYAATKARSGEELNGCDVVLTTYGTLAAECDMGNKSSLQQARWLRVILDEGHYIKNHRTKTAKAANQLNTQRRWLITGTPIQNNLTELWSLVHWLQFDLYVDNMADFKRQIVLPCENRDPSGMKNLQTLMDTVCLRRTKGDKKMNGDPIVKLPSKTVIIRDVEFTEEENFLYNIFKTKAQEIVNRFHKKDALMKNYGHIFVLMTRLRQLCCHRNLINSIDWTQALNDRKALEREMNLLMNPTGIGAGGFTRAVAGGNVGGEKVGVEDDKAAQLVRKLSQMVNDGTMEECGICLEDSILPVITRCSHVYCRPCIERVIDTLKPEQCPLCRRPISKADLLAPDPDFKPQAPPERSMLEYNLSSSKVNAAMKELLRIRKECCNEKVIVVSQFTSFLDIIQTLLVQEGFSFVRLDGTMSQSNRRRSIDAFQAIDPMSPKVLILSLKAGGVGLNLTSGNHLLLMEPAWNPAIEWQVFDRMHRIGQTKDVTIYKYIMRGNSIEESMLEIQERKRDIITGAFLMSDDERRRQRINEILSVFNINPR